MKATLSANQSLNQNHFFSKTADRNFMKFHINFWFLKDKKVIQPGKNLIFRKKPKISLKLGHFSIGKKIVPFLDKPMHHSCFYDSAKTACFGKISLNL